MKLKASGFEKIGKAKIVVEFNPSSGRWEAREKASFQNLWFGYYLCSGLSRAAVIDQARAILQERARRETVEVDL